jgi:hypothetical protein
MTLLTLKKAVLHTLPIIVSVLGLTAAATGAGVVGSGTPESCTEAAFTAALGGDGLITFNCGSAPHEILLTAQKVVPVGTTTIRGAGLVALSGGNASRLFVVPTGATLVSEDIVLRNGRASQPSDQGSAGGAVLVDGGTFTLTRSTIRDSGTALTGMQTGGAIENVNGAVTLIDSLIEGNDSDSGGGIHTSGAAPSLILVNTIVRNNRARAGDGVGGGLDVRGAVTITGGRIEGNTAGRGGGLHIGAATVGITDTIVTKNAAKLPQGGGILNGGTLTLTNVILSDNTSGSLPMEDVPGAGLYNATTGVATLVGALVTGNRPAEEDSGTGAITSVGQLAVHGSVIRDNPEAVGIWVAEDAGAIITDTTIAGSAVGLVACPGSLTASRTTIAGSLGGGLVVGGSASLDNSTISGNRFTGVFLDTTCGEAAVNFLNSTIVNNEIAQLIARNAGRTITLKNTIVSGGDGAACGILDGGQIVSDGFNISDDDSCNLNAPGDKPNTDPLLGPLQPNGGPTPTHALLPGSPAISGATNLDCPAVDQRGFSRPRGPTCDAGAFEFGVLVAAVGLNASAFVTGETVAYEGTVNPGLTPTQVDIYLGVALPGGLFLSFVEQAPGVVGVVTGPLPVPYQANVPAAPLAVLFDYTFGGTEPAGTYLTYAALIAAGTDPFNPANQLSLEIRPFALSP